MEAKAKLVLTKIPQTPTEASMAEGVDMKADEAQEVKEDPPMEFPHLQ